MYLSLNHMVEERTFLYSVCSKTLRVDKSIKFTSVINGEGKLIVGKSKQCIIKKNINRDYNFFRSKQNSLSNILSYDNNDSIHSIINMKNIIIHSNSKIKSDFQLINVDDDIYIALVSLNENLDKYLCIYFESYPPLYDVLLKLNTIIDCLE
jgi:hypothetical protein